MFFECLSFFPKIFFTYTALHFCWVLIIIYLFYFCFSFLAHALTRNRNTIQFTSLNSRSKPASICAQFCALSSSVYPPPTWVRTACAALAVVVALLALCLPSSSNRMGQPIAFVFCFCFARCLCVCICLCFFFALLCSAQFDELLSSPFVKLRCTLRPSRLRARLHCTALRVSASRVYDYVSVCVCECRLMDSSSSKWW